MRDLDHETHERAFALFVAFRGYRGPSCPLDEQRRIVEYLDAVQAKVEAIRRYQEEAREEIEAMTGAVLERAFRGEL